MKKIILLIILIMVVVFAYFISLAPNYKSINISETLSVARSTLKENQEIIVFDSKISQENFWRDKLTAQKIVKEKKFLENIGILNKIE